MIRVLFDENMPAKLRRDLAEFDIRTAQEEGWSALQNGALLRAAQERFAVLLTVDRRLEYQQNLDALRIAVVVVTAESTRLVHLRPLVARIATAIKDAKPGTVTVVAAG